MKARQEVPMEWLRSILPFVVAVGLVVTPAAAAQAPAKPKPPSRPAPPAAEKTDKTKAVVRSILDQHTDAMLTCDAVQHESRALMDELSRGPTLCRAAFASRPVTIIEGGPLPQGTAAVYKRVATRAEIWVPEHVAQFASAMPGAPSALVLCVREEMQRTGQEYGRGIPAYRRAWEVRAVRAADGLIQALGDFSTPPRSRSGRENSAPGRRPTQRSSSGWKHKDRKSVV